MGAPRGNKNAAGKHSKIGIHYGARSVSRGAKKLLGGMAKRTLTGRKARNKRGVPKNYHWVYKSNLK